MIMPVEIFPTLLAPCGMNCMLCYAHLRKKKPCPGCRGDDPAKPGHCRECKIRDCAAGRGLDYCHACPDFPCQVIKRLDKSYRQRYHVSLIEMTLRHREAGLDVYLREEGGRWRCARCGGVVCLHDQACSECGAVPPA